MFHDTFMKEFYQIIKGCSSPHLKKKHLKNEKIFKKKNGEIKMRNKRKLC